MDKKDLASSSLELYEAGTLKCFVGKNLLLISELTDDQVETRFNTFANLTYKPGRAKAIWRIIWFKEHTKRLLLKLQNS